MSTTPPHQKPGDHSHYAAIRSPQGSATPDAAPGPVAPVGTASPGFAAELAKLQEMRDALWDAFKAGPDAGFPTILIELTNSYANSLRIQLNMKGLDIRRTANAGKVPQPSRANIKE